MFNRKESTFKVPIWALSIGLFGVVNFLIGCWVLFPPAEGNRVYFWFVEFYSYALLPTVLFFPFSIFIVVLWLSRSMKWPLSKFVVLIIGIAVAVYGFVIAFGTVAFVSTLNVVGKVEQNRAYYYLLKYYDDTAPSYLFCKSDSIGFSGSCKYIGWKGDDPDPKIYINQSTNWITVEAVNPSFIWINSVPPKCINSLDENDDEWFVGGCVP